MSSGAHHTSQTRGALPANPSPQERLIVALDFDNSADALRLVDSLKNDVSFYKVGLELFVAAGSEMIAALKERNVNIFLDLKMDDVVETITRAVRQVAKLGVQLLTINGGLATARAAVDGRGDSPSPKLLQITLLTSMDGGDLEDMGLLGPDKKFASTDEYIAFRATQSLDAGCDGLITSGENVGALHARFGQRRPKPLFICPGIRPGGLSTDDHKRPCTPYEAVRDGADYLVVGRPIKNAEDRRDMARRIIDDIARGLADREKG